MYADNFHTGTKNNLICKTDLLEQGSHNYWYRKEVGTTYHTEETDMSGLVLSTIQPVWAESSGSVTCMSP